MSCFFIRGSLSFVHQKTIEGMEQPWITVLTNKLKYTFGVEYKPYRKLSFNLLNSLQDTFSEVLTISDKSFCFGDLNINLLDSKDAATIQYADFLSISFKAVGCRTHTGHECFHIINRCDYWPQFGGKC